MEYAEFKKLCHAAGYNAPEQHVFESEIEKIYASSESITKNDIVGLACCWKGEYSKLVTNYNRVTSLAARLAVCGAYEYAELSEKLRDAIYGYRAVVVGVTNLIHLGK